MRNIEEIINRQINRWNSLVNLLPAVSALHEGTTSAPTKNRHPAIAISRQLGSGARDIAGQICNRLGYNLYGKDVIEAVARDLNVQRRLIDSLDESGKGELQLMLESYLQGREIESSDYHTSLVRIMRTMAVKGGVVLIGRGACQILKDRSALNILVVASLNERIDRVAHYAMLEPDKARELVEEADRARAKFVKKYFKTDVNDPLQYDLVINTDRIEPSAAVHLVFEALKSRGYNLDEMTIHPASAVHHAAH